MKLPLLGAAVRALTGAARAGSTHVDDVIEPAAHLASQPALPLVPHSLVPTAASAPSHAPARNAIDGAAPGIAVRITVPPRQSPAPPIETVPKIKVKTRGTPHPLSPTPGDKPAHAASAPSLPRIKITSQIHDNPHLAKRAEAAGRAAQRDLDHLTHELAQGNMNPGIGTRHIVDDIYEARARSGARVYFAQRKGGTHVVIVAKSTKDDQEEVCRILRAHAAAKRSGK